MSEGGDKVYLRYDKAVDPSSLANSLKAIGVNTNQVQTFGRADENTYEVTLVGLDTEIRHALDAKLGEGAVAAIPSSSRSARRPASSCSTTARARCSTRSC